ncbi:unnamed protein product [Prunus brigantina]
MFASSSAKANKGDSDGSWEYAPDYPRSPPPPLPLPTSSASEGDSNDPAVEINDMKNKLEHNSSLVHYWTQKCVGAEQKLAYLTRQVNKACYRKEKQRIRGDNQGQAMFVAFNEGFKKFRQFAADVHKDIDKDAITPFATQEIISNGAHPTKQGHQPAKGNNNDW